MSYVILDLEWNGTYSKSAKRFVNEIIEFGALKVDSSLQVTDSFSVLIQPAIGKRLCGKVKELTKITIEELRDGGVDFAAAAEQFAAFLGDSTLMTWGTSDIHALIDNYRFYTGDYHIPFLSSYCDLQEYCEVALDCRTEGSQLGLGACAGKLGIAFSDEEQHRAAADAYLSLRCLQTLCADFPIEDFVHNARDEAFYTRMMFKNYFITDLRSPAIDRSLMAFRCDSCGRRARRTKRWRLHNKNFSAPFTCRHCGRSFIGRISFKQRYDGVKVNKRIVEKPEKSKQSEENSESS